MIPDIDKSLEASSHYYRSQHSSTDGNELPKKSRSRPSDPDFIAQTQRVIERIRHFNEQSEEEEGKNYLQSRHKKSTKVGAKKRKAVDDEPANTKKERWDFLESEDIFKEESKTPNYGKESANTKKERWDFHESEDIFKEESTTNYGKESTVEKKSVVTKSQRNILAMFVNTEDNEDETEFDTPVNALIEGRIKSVAIEREQNISTASTAESESTAESASSPKDVSVNSQEEEKCAFLSLFQKKDEDSETEEFHSQSLFSSTRILAPPKQVTRSLSFHPFNDGDDDADDGTFDL